MKYSLQALIGLAFTISSLLVFAHLTGEDYEVAKNTIDGGGSTSSGGEFTITGTIGQHDTNSANQSGSSYSADTGFWANAISTIFESGFEAGD